MNEWINVNIQTPDQDGRYLAFWGTVFIGIYTKSINKWENENTRTGLNQHVSHWMLLPEPPKG